jgi:hypothetical protein
MTGQEGQQQTHRHKLTTLESWEKVGSHFPLSLSLIHTEARPHRDLARE